MKRFGVGTLVLTVSLLTASVGGASPQDLFGYGARAGALGMTGVATANNYEAVYYNPAGLAEVRQRGLWVGMQAAAFQLRLDDSPYSLQPLRATTIGVELPLPFGGILKDRLVLGMGFFTPTNVIIDAEILYPEVPQFPVLSRAQSLAIQAGLSINLDDVAPGLTLGVSFSVLASMLGEVTAGLGSDGKFGSKVETQLVATYSPIVGARYRVGDFTFAAVWRGELRADFKLDIITSDLPVDVPVLIIGGLAQYDPMNASIEIAYRPTAAWQLTVGGIWHQWSAFPGGVTKTSQSSTPPPNPDFHDTFAPRAAAEYTLHRGGTDLAFRMGYAYEPTPAPKATATARYLDNDRHVVTAGVGATFRLADGDAAPRLRADVFGQAGLLAPRTHAGPDEGETRNMKTSGVVAAGGLALGVSW